MPAVDARVAVLASGAGTNLQALLDDEVTGPWISVVFSDQEDAGALQRARNRGVDAVWIDPKVYVTRDDFDGAVVAGLGARRIECVVLAGYMRILGPSFVKAYEGRILNVHPALLPAFPGAAAVAGALAYGVKVTGVTVHFVDEEVDHGPVVFQEPIAVLPDDDWDPLEARVHEVEHRLLPAAVRAFVQGRISVDGRIVRVKEEEG